MSRARFLPLDEAAALLRDGQSLAPGGMTLYRRPLAFIRALLRRPQPPRDLTLLAFTAGIESDLLVGDGCVAVTHSVYFGLEAFGLAPMFTAAAAEGRIRVIEETELSMVCGLRATLAATGFMPARAWKGSDLPRLRPDVRMVTDPYSGEEHMAFPAIPVDVAVLHGVAADPEGNVLLNRNPGIDMELVYCADLVIVTVERMVAAVRPAAHAPVLPAPGADVIALAPRGAWPTSCHPLYPLAGGELMRYVDMCNAGRFGEWLTGFLAADFPKLDSRKVRG